MDGGPISTIEIDQTDTLNDIVNPLYKNINILCNRAEQEAQSNPTDAGGIAEDLLKQTHSMLKTIHWVLPKGEDIKDSSYNRVAEAVWNCTIDYSNKTNNWSKAFDLMKNVWFLANGEIILIQLEKDIKTLEKKYES